MDQVRFKGGLGNQMFQYAFLKSLEERGRNVKASLGYYDLHPELMQFELDKVFSNVCMRTGTEEEFLEKYERWCEIKKDDVKLKRFLNEVDTRFFWSESISENGNYQDKVYETKECVFAGYWQTYKYFEKNRNKLLSDFQFDIGEEKLELLIDKIKNSDRYVSVHVRRGDYLNLNELYGGVCTLEYYKKALELISNSVENPIIVFFSDDIQWVKQEFNILNAIYIEKSLFENYQDWYDMKIMTVCSHNIIANSSFSWWGAWLNQRQGRKAIAPDKWINGYEFKDIYPKEWIRICD